MRTNNFRVPAPLSLTGNISENFRKFKQNFEIYVKAQDFDRKKSDIKVAILLNIIGDEAVELYNTFDLSDVDKNKYESVLTAFENYCIPKKNVVVEHFKFNSRIQFELESFDNYYTDIKKLVKSCEYNDQTDSVLRDRIVLGIRDKSQQESLLRIKDLTLEKAVEFCKTAKLSKQQAEYLHSNNNTPILHSLNKSNVGFREKSIHNEFTSKLANKNKIDCKNRPVANTYRCKKCNTVHEYAKCPAYGKTCKNCGMLGHFKIGCKFKKVRSLSDKIFCSSEESKSSCGDHFVNQISSAANNFNTNIKEWNVNLQFENNKYIKFKLDTGAQVNVLPLHVFKEIKSKSVIRKSNLVLEAYGGNKILTVGRVELKCKLSGSSNSETIIDFVLIDAAKAIPLLGLKGCLQMNLISKINTVKSEDLSSKEVFLKTYKSNFERKRSFEEEFI